MASRVPADITLSEAARRLGLKPPAFRDIVADLYADGFPRPDKRTGRFDPEAVERWRRQRNPHLFPELSTPKLAKDASSINVMERLKAL